MGWWKTWASGRSVGLWVVAICAGSLGCAEHPPADPCADRPATDRQSLDEAVASGLVPGAIVWSSGASGPSVEVAGSARLAPERPMEADGTFRTASNGKLFVGVLAAILALEGELDLDAPVAPHLDPAIVARIANADVVTMRQLLTHRGGLAEFVGPEFIDAMIADPTHAWTDAEAVAYAFDRPATSPPGTAFAYSNTGYCLASLALASITGAHPSVALREKVLIPFGLTETWWENHDAVDASRFVHGYTDVDGDGSVEDLGETEALAGLGAGGLVSTAADLGRFYRALFDDEGFPADRYDRAALIATIDPPSDAADGYGFGVVKTPTGAYSHDGSVPGYDSFVAHLPATDTTVVLFVNRSGDRDADDDPAQRVIDRLWTDVVCHALGR